MIKALAAFCFLINFTYSAELPEDHPIKTAVQMVKFAFVQYPCVIDTSTPYGIVTREMTIIQSSVLLHLKNCANTLFLQDEFKNTLLIHQYIQQNINRIVHPGHRSTLDISSTLDVIITELNTYIHHSFENHFNLRMEGQKFASAYRLALVFRDANTAHEENITKANVWINQIRVAATAEVEELAETYMVLAGTNLRAKQRFKADQIIKSFQPTDDLRVRLQHSFDAVLARPAPLLPTAERLTVYREIVDKLFKNDDA